VPIQSIKLNAAWKKAGTLLVVGVVIFAAWSFARMGLANSASVRTEDKDIALVLTDIAPNDPQAHYTAAVFLERSFDPGDIERALREYELATALAPENYLYWLELGRARERSGDSTGAEGALRKALELAPNYSRVQWALGNALLRQGRVDEGFVEIKKAIASDPTAYSNASAITAWQFFGGDTAAIRRAVGDSPRFDGSLALLLAQEKRFDEAMKTWRGIAADDRKNLLVDTAKILAGKFLAEKQFRFAAEVLADSSDPGSVPKAGSVTNSGFESAVKPDTAGPFEWKIAAGLQPQIVLTNGEKHGGNNSLLFVFNSGDAKDFRTVSQTVAIEPAAAYEVEIFYRSDVKTSAIFRWEVADADGKPIALSDPIANKAEWSPLRIRFTAPANVDGVIVRLVREGCSQVCAVTGSLWFDDISIKPAQ
jgi:Flp pilus assembly protein TadD